MLSHAFVGGDSAIEFFLCQLSCEILRAYSTEGALDSFDGVLSEPERIRSDDIPNEFNPSGRPDTGLVVEVQMEAIEKEFPDFRPVVVGRFLIRRKQNDVVHVPCVKSDMENMLAKLIQLVEVDVRKELACEIADRHSNVCEPVIFCSFCRADKTRQAEFLTLAVDDLVKKPQELLVFDPDLQEVHQDFMVYAVKVFADVQLDDVPFVGLAVDQLHPVADPQDCGQ